MSVVSGTVGAIMGSQSQDKATSANKRNARDTNAANLLLNLMTRGGVISQDDANKYGLPASVVGKSSAILPYYLGETESLSAQDAANLYKTITESAGTPESQIAAGDQVLRKFNPAFDGTDQLAIDIGSGAVTQQMVDEAKPVAQARTDLAESKRSAGLEALKATLNEIDAIQARKGFTGDSFGNRLLRFNAGRAIGTQGAADVGQANLENAIEKAGLQQQGRNLRLSNIALPETAARAAIERTRIPSVGLVANQALAMQPLQPFNIGPGAASQYQRFTQDPSTSPWQLVAQGAGAAGNAAANYFLNRQLQKQAVTDYASAQQGAYARSASAGTAPGVFSTGSGGSLSGAVDFAPAGGGAMLA